MVMMGMVAVTIVAIVAIVTIVTIVTNVVDDARIDTRTTGIRPCTTRQETDKDGERHVADESAGGCASRDDGQ